MLETMFIAVALMGGLALIFGCVLAVAYRFLRVEEDPRLEPLEELLPGTNCGACGTPGCRAFAESLLAGVSLPALCTVSGPDELDDIAAFLGVEAGSIEKRVARLHCAGGIGFVRDLAAYRGISSCRAAVLVNAGGRGCSWACLGLADCERACDFDAISMNPQGLPRVDVNRCTACNDCVEVCPLDLFTLEPLSQPLLLQCNSPMTGAAARGACAVACDGCGRCAADLPSGVLEMHDGSPVILEGDRTETRATWRCPTGAIQWVKGNQFSPETSSKRTVRSVPD